MPSRYIGIILLAAMMFGTPVQAIVMYRTPGLTDVMGSFKQPRMALIDPLILASTLFLYSPIPGKEADVELGTGFIVARPNTYNYERPEEHDFKQAEKETWRLWLVTAAHVIPNDPKRIVNVEINLSGSLEGRSKKTTIDIPAARWFRHPKYSAQPGTVSEYDVAVTPAEIRTPRWQDIEYSVFPAGQHMSRQSMRAYGISEGNGVYIMGFPLGRGRGSRNAPMMRHGIIAQVQPYLRGENSWIIIDGTIWGGNSGGPVVTQPHSLAVEGTKSYRKISLIGMVIGITEGPVRIIDGGDSKLDQDIVLPAGFGFVIPTETINQTIDLLIEKHF